MLRWPSSSHNDDDDDDDDDDLTRFNDLQSLKRVGYATVGRSLSLTCSLAN